MPAGIQVFNTAGTITIDETYQNLALRASGGMYFSTSGNQDASFSYGLSMTKPVAAVRVTGAPAGVRRCVTSGGTTTLTVSGMAGASVTWYVFDVPYAVSNAGLQVFRADGTLCFDAGNKYARVVDYWTAPNRESWENTTRYYGDGRIYAAAFLSHAERKQVVQQSSTGCSASRYRQRISWFNQMCQVTSGTNNTTFTFNAWRADTALDTECTRLDIRYKYDCAIAMLDVTGY